MHSSGGISDGPIHTPGVISGGAPVLTPCNSFCSSQCLSILSSNHLLGYLGFFHFGSLDPSLFFTSYSAQTDVNAKDSDCWWLITAHLLGKFMRIPSQLVLMPMLSMEFGVCYLVVLFWVCIVGAEGSRVSLWELFNESLHWVSHYPETTGVWTSPSASPGKWFKSLRKSQVVFRKLF